ncbi:transcription antitermination factor NusB [Candidatus Dependentiae bacterium]|nr:transcription antitermination factor NusB [Candidatus Dependentiae bacterium]
MLNVSIRNDRRKNNMDIKPEHEIVDCNSLSQKDQRGLILHILYACDANDYSTIFENIVENIARGFDLIIPKDSFVYTTSKAIVENRESLDDNYKHMIDNWRFERVGVCTKLILRLAFWELLNTDTPASIIINEAIELAKCFAEQDSYKFINGILDEYIKSKERQASS